MARKKGDSQNFREGYDPKTGELVFKAEILNTSQKKASDLTQRYRIMFETANPNLMDLGKLPYDAVVIVKVGLSEEKVRK